MTTRVLYLVVSAAGSSPGVGALVSRLLAADWDVYVVATPNTVDGGFVDVDALDRATGRPVRHRWRRADEISPWPKPDAVVAAPCTLNTLTKWADGHADAFALGVLTEGLGMGLPCVALPFFNAAQAAHPAVPRAVATLREAGVRVLYGPGEFEPWALDGEAIPGETWDMVVGALADEVQRRARA